MDDGQTRKRRPRSTAAQTRQHLLDTAAEVMERLGMANATTKEIARASGYSEATLYKHFTDKSELFLEVLRHRFPPFVGDLAALPERVGRDGVRDTLVGIVLGAVPFFRHGSPMLGSLFAEPDLLRRHREGLSAHGAGPLNVNRAVAAYLAAERDLGRVESGTDPDATAALLVGACFQRGFLEAFSEGTEGFPPLDRFAADLVEALGVVASDGLADASDGPGAPGGSGGHG
ncbi:TetR/AcrR family transcriptional regulator [Nocardiopsis exhalans]|uniref:TetR/AcrR family transcriptional regulator n=1 Tax=Nocardiopsis exhalans TaxID=163604 RepID=A0ABY5D6H5_9ACTN|nr:TetR/AcrR family transcriptional regulator [Nocardiopsis exhalans]USY18833.1 TetR/AcrR family transcriptional regulator [Nocardiopsis exhalans]